MITNKISSLENRINQNLINTIELSKRVKETESFQDELNQQLNKAIKDAEEFNKIANGINEIVKGRKKDLVKNNEKKD
jgi:nitrogenase subunit NifH